MDISMVLDWNNMKKLSLLCNIVQPYTAYCTQLCQSALQSTKTLHNNSANNKKTTTMTNIIEVKNAPLSF